MTPDAVIAVDALVKRFGDFVAVNGISFTVARGEIFGFLGPNGAGKTTTIRMLLGLLQPTSGRVTVLGHDVTRQRKAMQSRVGYMSQVFTLYPDLTAEENVAFYGRVYGLQARELEQRKRAVLEMAGRIGHEHELTARLSGGWRQRLALGCAIVHAPELVFLDEPTGVIRYRREFWGDYDLGGGGNGCCHHSIHGRGRQLPAVGFIGMARGGAGCPPSSSQAHGRGGLESRFLRREGAMPPCRCTSGGVLALDEVALYGG